tara:strand:- start:145 stop:1101 length:957 start_codon:yes stop_codon:yes gene_type:complete
MLQVFLLLFYFLTIFLLSLVIFRILIPIFKKKLIDIPNYRSSHKIATPTSGGIIIALLTCFFDLINNTFISFICLPLAFIGFLDDKKNISSILRFFSQLLTVLILILITNLNSNLLSFLPNSYFLLILLPFSIFLAGIINLTNFMDGIDGLVAGSMLIIFTFFSIKNNLLFSSIIPVLCAFLIYNWQPSKIFMGDSGSNFIGSIYILMLLDSSSLKDFLILISLASPLFLDSCTCLIRRYFYKQNIFKPHKLHLYQRLVQSGYSHRLVSSIYLLATFLITLISLSNNLKIILITVLLYFIIGYFIDIKYAVSFRKASL